LVRLLILFGGELFDETANQTVGQFILANIDDVIDNFDSELYQRVAKEFKVLIERGDQPSTAYFMQHEAPDLRQLSIDLASSPYEFSENWESKWDVVLNQKKPDDNFIKDSTHGLKRFRLRKLSRICKENINKVKELAMEGNEIDMMLYMQLQQKLQVLRNDLAKELGTVVF
jgi:DNA primase